jgi:hypothetical protein
MAYKYNPFLSVGFDNIGTPLTAGDGIDITGGEVSLDLSNFSQGTINLTGTTININSGHISLPGVVEYADNAAALLGGLVADEIYHTAGVLKIVV